jgi:hypothetical protein
MCDAKEETGKERTHEERLDSTTDYDLVMRSKLRGGPTPFRPKNEDPPTLSSKLT